MSKNRRILVVDDNPSLQADFRKIFSHNQDSSGELRDLEAGLFGEKAEPRPVVTFEVDFATQGQEGYQMVLEAAKRGRPYATAFVDVRMPPGWDGIETVERMRQLINDLLALSRVTTQAKPCEPVNLNTLVSEVLSDLEVLVEQVHRQLLARGTGLDCTAERWRPRNSAAR